MFEWEAFAELSTDRPVGLTHGAIPWSSIHNYALRYGIEGDDFVRFAHLIRAMDAVWLSRPKEEPDAQP
jgi:hypothetical protein